MAMTGEVEHVFILNSYPSPLPSSLDFTAERPLHHHFKCRPPPFARLPPPPVRLAPAPLACTSPRDLIFPGHLNIWKLRVFVLLLKTPMLLLIVVARCPVVLIAQKTLLG
ncbi:hypothetical protein ACOSQ3_027805 [Xanthoceras sorbifolium]